jgi:uncharacterized repeat protein (TIGR03803 family)
MKKSYLLLSVLFLLGIGAVKAQYDILHVFDLTHGGAPYGSLTVSGGLLYGMTSSGGLNDSGCIFSVDTNGHSYNELYDFGKASGGILPSGTLLLSGGVFYGESGSMLSGPVKGCVFSINPNGTGYKNLLEFSSVVGTNPTGSLACTGDTLYGMLEYQGAHSYGSIFSVKTDGSGYKDVFDFSSTTGQNPSGGLCISGNVMYAMTSFGGANHKGCVFSINKDGSNYTDLHDFSGTDGEEPSGYNSLILSGNILYGMTVLGGVNGGGAIFSIHTNGADFETLHSFGGLNDGLGPQGSLVLSPWTNTLYGMTQVGGTDGDGIIFSIDTNGSGYTPLEVFNGTLGADPWGSLTIFGDALFGMTNMGGDADTNYGVIFGYRIPSLGINKLTTNSGAINVYPNPNNGIFTIALSHTELVSASQTSVEIYNVMGERVKSEELRAKSEEVDLSNQPNGVYFYRVLSENGGLIGDGKLIIQK